MVAWFFHPFAPLIVIPVAQTGLLIATLRAESTIPPGWVVALPLLWTLQLAFWAEADARRRRRTPCFDFGFFCYLFLPLAIPWYCFRSRGGMGALLLIGLMALWIAPNVIAVFVWMIWWGRP